MKKLTVLIAIIILLTFSVGGVACTNDTTNDPTIPVTKGTDGLEYALSEGGSYAICTGIGSATDSTVTVSSHYNGLVVEEIQASAFTGQDSIEKLIIPEGVKKINNKAFRNCKNLGSVTLPSTLTEIGTDAFYLCKKLFSVNNHSALAINRWDGANGSVGYYACNVYNSAVETEGVTTTEGDYTVYSFGDQKYVVAYVGSETAPAIPDDVTGINCFAFYQNPNVTEISIPSNIKAIGAYAFWGNTALATITFEENCSLEIIGSIAFENCPIQTFNFNDGIDEWLNISFESPESNPLFYVKALTLKEGDIENIVVGNQVTSIKKNAFYNCNNIKNITLSESVTAIEAYAFYNSSLGNITFAKNGNLKTIGVKSFSRETTTADDTVNSAKGTPGPQITDLIIPVSVEVIDMEAFMNCEELKTVKIEDNNNLITISDYAFCGCEKLQSFIIGDYSKLTTLGRYAIQACRKMTDFSLGRDSVLKIIGTRAFQYSNGLQKFFIPKTVEEIGGYCFGAIGNSDPSGGRSATLYIEAEKNGSLWSTQYNSSSAKTAYGVSYDEYLTK